MSREEMQEGDSRIKDILAKVKEDGNELYFASKDQQNNFTVEDLCTTSQISN